MLLQLNLSDADLQLLAARIAELIAPHEPHPRWLDVAGAATHLGMTENAIRGLVKRRQIPFHRTPNGRLRFSVTELDEWVRTGSCEPTDEDLP